MRNVSQLESEVARLKRDNKSLRRKLEAARGKDGAPGLQGKENTTRKHAGLIDKDTRLEILQGETTSLRAQLLEEKKRHGKAESKALKDLKAAERTMREMRRQANELRRDGRPRSLVAQKESSAPAMSTEFNAKRLTKDPFAFPVGIWTSPEAAYFGLSKKQALEQNINADEGLALYRECLRGCVLS